MNLSKKVLYTMGVLVSVGLLFSVAGVSGSTPAEEEYDEDTYGPSELMVWNTPVPRVTFSHKVHTMDVGLDCDSCHDDLFEMESGAVVDKGDFIMQSFADGNYCGACHDGDMAFSTDSPDMCSACHSAPNTIVFTKPVKAVVFDHKMHVEDMGFNCGDCHSDLFKMHIGAAEENPDAFIMEALYKGEYCGACHDGDSAFASDTRCTTCHIGVMGFDRLFGHGEKKGGH
jgi:c(7)-type cytochrome triheme protein